MTSVYFTCMVRPMLCGYRACTICSCPTVKVTVVTMMSVGNSYTWSCSVTSPCNLEMTSVHVPLPRSLSSWWHHQVTWMWCDVHCNQVLAGLVLQQGLWETQLPSTWHPASQHRPIKWWYMFVFLLCEAIVPLSYRPLRDNTISQSLLFCMNMLSHNDFLYVLQETE